MPHCFQNIDSPQDVRLVSINRIFIGLPHKRLRRQMDHDLRFRTEYGLLQVPKVPDISLDRVHPSGELQNIKKTRIRGRCCRISRYSRSGKEQDLREPAALKTGMTCQKDFFPFVCIEYRNQTAFPPKIRLNKVCIAPSSRCPDHRNSYAKDQSQIFQGAFPLSHIFSRICFSRSVSMHCQKPLCL